MTEAKEEQPEKRVDNKAVEALFSVANSIYDQIDHGKIPKMVLPLRTKSNIRFDPKHGVFKYGPATGARTAKKTNGAMMLLRTMYTLELIEDMIDKNKSSTLREMYYISEGWGKAKFHSQDESNLLAEDLEIVTKCMREDFKLRPEENGASVIGNITIEEFDRKGRVKRINCLDDVGDSGYGIPYNVEKEKVKIIERSTRRFIKRLNEEMNLPVIVFTDGDPWSFRIFASVAYGAIKTAHISEYLATPSAQFIGITATDIMHYNLPTDKLTDMDVRALNAELNDPRFADRYWKDEIETMLKLNKKAEQQALAKYGLDFVTDKYMPDKLNELGLLKK
jgi:DNA topoisomerase-6 subunit A